MKRFLFFILIVFIFTSSVSASGGEDLFNEWKSIYFDEDNVNSNTLDYVFNRAASGGVISKEDFFDLSYLYECVFADEDSSKISSRMSDDFSSADKDSDEVLSFDEFSEYFAPLCVFYNIFKDYTLFKSVDTSGDGRVSLDEFSEVSYLYDYDSFWDGYSVEEVAVSEFENINGGGDSYLNFTEFLRIC